MAKKRLKLTPAGILFLIAIGVLIIALIAVIVVLSTTCGGEREATRANPSPSAFAEPSEEPTDLPELTDEPATSSDDPALTTDDPDATPDPNIPALQPNTTPEGGNDPEGGGITVTTPNITPTASPSATAKIYTSPTSAQKKKAKDGYVYKDKVKMRKGPATSYGTVKTDIAKNTSVTLYELQGEWWFLKCGSSYGYIRKDMIKEGKSPSEAKETSKATSDGSTYEGTIKTNSVAALRKSASKSSDCLKELKNGDKVTVYHKTKDKDGNTWYYVAYGKTKGYVSSSLISTSKKVPSK